MPEAGSLDGKRNNGGCLVGPGNIATDNLHLRLQTLGDLTNGYRNEGRNRIGGIRGLDLGSRVKSLGSLPETDASEGHGLKDRQCLALVIGYFNNFRRMVIKEPIRRNRRSACVRIRVALIDGLERILERVKEVAFRVNPLDVRPTESPETRHGAHFVLAHLAFAIHEQMPVSPAARLEFHLPSPAGGFRPEASLATCSKETAHMVLSGEITGERASLEKLRVKRQRDKAPVLEGREALGLDQLPFLVDPGSREPGRRIVGPHVDDLGKFRGGGLSAMSSGIVSRSASSAQPTTAESRRRRSVQNVSLWILRGERVPITKGAT